MISNIKTVKVYNFMSHTAAHSQPPTIESMKRIYEQVPPDYFDNSFETNLLQRVHYKWKYGRGRSLIDNLKDGSRILDVGCASGFSTEQATKHLTGKNIEIYGVDVYGGAIQVARQKRPKMHFQVGAGEDLPFPDKYFDVITFFDILEHFIDPAAALLEAKRCLKDDGYMMIEIFFEENTVWKVIWEVWKKFKGKVWDDAHLHIFDEQKFGSLLGKAGLKIAKTKVIYPGFCYANKIVKV